MARTFIDVDQSNYISLGGELGSYGVHRSILDDALIVNRDVAYLNNHYPMIHFNMSHTNEDGIPSGEARVLQVKWAAPTSAARGELPYVRLRELPFGVIGTNKTKRKRYTPIEVMTYIKTFTNHLTQL